MALPGPRGAAATDPVPARFRLPPPRPASTGHAPPVCCPPPGPWLRPLAPPRERAAQRLQPRLQTRRALPPPPQCLASVEGPQAATKSADPNCLRSDAANAGIWCLQCKPGYYFNAQFTVRRPFFSLFFLGGGGGPAQASLLGLHCPEARCPAVPRRRADQLPHVKRGLQAGLAPQGRPGCVARPRRQPSRYSCSHLPAPPPPSRHALAVHQHRHPPGQVPRHL